MLIHTRHEPVLYLVPGTRGMLHAHPQRDLAVRVDLGIEEQVNHPTSAHPQVPCADQADMETTDLQGVDIHPGILPTSSHGV